jgi:hypothetical protein
MKNVQKKVFGASAVVTMVTLGITAQAQRPAPTPQPAPTPTVQLRAPSPAPTLTPQLAVPLQAPQFAPEIKPALVGKKAFDPKPLAGRVRQVNGVTLLKIKNGREYPLMPIGTEPTPPARLQMKAIPPHLLQYKAHIEAPILAGKRVIKQLGHGQRARRLHPPELRLRAGLRQVRLRGGWGDGARVELTAEAPGRRGTAGVETVSLTRASLPARRRPAT